MINTKNVLTGYVIIRGTYIVHAPMFGIMIWMSVNGVCPSPESKNFEHGNWWWILALVLHFILGTQHLFSFFEPSISEMLIEGFKIITVLT